MYSYYAKTSAADVARMESRTYVSTKNKEDTVPTPKENVVSKLGNWKSVEDMDKELTEKFAGCMRGKSYNSVV